MRPTTRRQQSYDHRLRDLVRQTRYVTIATDLGVPRSTARGWLTKTTRPVVTLEEPRERVPELQRESLHLRRRVQKLTALLRLVVVVLRVSGFTLIRERLPEGRSKRQILRAVRVLDGLSPRGS